jgi:uncharacterized iron-regulated membrane protein
LAGPSKFRNAVLTLHLWAGLIAALLLLLIGGSGALLVFEARIDHALNPSLSRVSSAQEPLYLKELKSSLEQQYPGYRAFEFNISQSSDLAYAAYLETASGDGLNVAVNQYTGKNLGVWNNNRFATKLHQFHTHLLMGRTGAAIVALGSAFLLFMSISGLILWWRSKIFRINFQSAGPKFQYDVHSTVGIASLVFLLIFAVTGLMVHWDDALRKWAVSVSHVPAQSPPAKRERGAPGAVQLDPDQLLSRAQVAVPGARATRIDLSATPDQPTIVTMKFPEDHTPAGRTRVVLDSYSGDVLSFTSSRAAPLAVSYTTRLNREIHTGDIGGWPTRILAAVFSMSLPLLAITGPLLWWKRRKRD